MGMGISRGLDDGPENEKHLRAELMRVEKINADLSLKLARDNEIIATLSNEIYAVK